MTSELQLSDELIQDLQKTLYQYDERATDLGIAVQYYAAIIGYSLGLQTAPYEQRQAYLEQLMGFAQHVFDDVSSGQEEDGEAGHSGDEQSGAEPGEASGVWRPGDD